MVRDDGLWVQVALLRLGLARVYSFADNQTAVADMLVEERAARRAGRGIWALPFYRIRNPGELTGDIDSFQVVEGRVVAVAAAGIELARLAGRAVRLRGWIRRRNGPALT